MLKLIQKKKSILNEATKIQIPKLLYLQHTNNTTQIYIYKQAHNKRKKSHYISQNDKPAGGNIYI